MGTKFYTVAWHISRVFYNIIFPRKVYGMENIPKEGGFVLVANHMSNHDPMFLASVIPLDRPVHYMAKKELFQNPILRKIMYGLKSFPVDRGAADMSAIHTAMHVLQDGEVLGIFPQGTRSKDNSPTPMLSGTSLIALRAQAPVLPVYIDGPYHLFRHSDIYIGKPIDFSAFGRKCDRETLAKVTQLIEENVWGLKPDKNKPIINNQNL